MRIVDMKFNNIAIINYIIDKFDMIAGKIVDNNTIFENVGDHVVIQHENGTKVYQVKKRVFNYPSASLDLYLE